MKLSPAISVGFLLLLTSFSPLVAAANDPQVEISGDLRKWHAVSLTFQGPQTSEGSDPNPFLDYRLDVVFRRGSTAFTVPGFYAADGAAADTSATSGNRWKVHFVPDQEGTWRYRVSFRTGKDVAISDSPAAGQPGSLDGLEGGFEVGGALPPSKDSRTQGLLRYVGERYLRFAETGKRYLKGGADSPENFLGFADFDQTSLFPPADRKQRQGEAAPMDVHRYQPHAGDWKQGDPTWAGAKGKNIIGALNYLAGEGMNTVYFLTMNVEGDGKNVWPWTQPTERLRFDVSKLAQWDVVFTHMDRLGLLQHVVTQETENDQLLDGGELGRERKLYYRELIARFGHHPALIWNLGEENSNTNSQRKAFASYIARLDPYKHPIVVHTNVYTRPGERDEDYLPLLGFREIHGPSLQIGEASLVHRETLAWIERSRESGHPWFVCLDEIGPADVGVKPDSDDLRHDEIRKRALWGNLMAGGSGCEWYFGYQFAHNDLNCEDWRSRAQLWKITRHALDFFQNHLPFHEMESHDDLTAASDDYCFAKPGSIYAVYLPNGGTTALKLPEGSFWIQWYDPRNGGELQAGSEAVAAGPGGVSIGQPPRDADQDWVALVRRK